jgi:phosphotransferase system HPr (HPr) family protein
MSKFSLEVEVLDPIGLHARPAGQIVKLVKESGLEVTIGRPGEEFAKANSALRLMALKIKTGEKLTVEIETSDEAQAGEIVAQIQDFLQG